MFALDNHQCRPEMIKQSDNTGLIQPLREIAQKAGAEIQRIYHSGETIDVRSKTDDSPVTKADIAAHHIIVDGLARLTPEIPILSEEGIDDISDTERRHWHRYWLVDPLDGTKEFIDRTGEFTVNIALIDSHEAILGMVYLPERYTLYHAIKNQGAYKQQGIGKPTAGTSEKLSVRPIQDGQPLRVVASRRHGTESLQQMLDAVSQTFADIDKVNMGSSLKICALAEGKADWYPRLAPTSEWDTAAAQVILEQAGGKLVDAEFNPLRYNTRQSLLNPFFHAFADCRYDWQALLSKVGKPSRPSA